MKKFQDLVTKDKQKLRSKQKLSFRGLGNTVDLNQAAKAKDPKPHYPSFRALAAETKESMKREQGSSSIVEFTLRKQRSPPGIKEEPMEHSVTRFQDDEFVFVPKNKPKPAQNLEGICMIDSVVIDQDSVQYQPKNYSNQDLSTTEKNQVEHELTKVAVGLKKKLFNQSKTISSFREVMMEVNNVIQIETERSYSKILQQRAITRGRSISSPQKSEAINPSSNSFLSIVSKRSPLIKFQSNKTSPLQFESPLMSTNTNTRKQKSTSKQLKQRIVGVEGIKVTQFKFQ